MAAALLAAALAAIGHILGWQGVDTAAQVYRVDTYRRTGFELWDFRWYGGHWTPDYSLLYPPLAATLGIFTATVLSAGLAALAFDRLARRHLDGGWPASLIFAAGTLVAASIGQLTFLAGAALGLSALWAADRGWWPAAAVLAPACALTSPLTGAFLALAALAWALSGIHPRGWRARTAAARTAPAPPTAPARPTERRGRGLAPVALLAALAALAAAPVLAGAVLFPGDGPMPYPVPDWLWEMGVAAGLALAAGPRHRVVHIGALLWMGLATVSVLVASPLGGNVGRMEDLFALPLAAGLVWTRIPVLLPFAAVPLALSQWGPAWGSFTEGATPSAVHRSFYTGLDAALGRAADRGPAGRVEVVPTEWHWEAAYVTPVLPLARGWERQLDEADNPLFYAPGPLDPFTYRSWLVDNGVRFVALPSAPLDLAGRREAGLVAAGAVPGLNLIWQDTGWRLYAVADSPGIVSGPARLVSTGDGRLVLDAAAAGASTVRVRWSPDWYVSGGNGCVSRAGDWLSVHADGPGSITLELSLLDPGRTACRPSVAVSSKAL